MRTRYTITFDALGTGFCVEAECGQTHLGQACMDDHPNPAEFLAGQDKALAADAVRKNVAVNHLHTLSVAPEHRRQGVARRLMRRFVRCADAQGIGILTLCCAPEDGAGGPDTQALLAFYRRLGFVDTGKRPDGAPLLARKNPKIRPGASKKLKKSK